MLSDRGNEKQTRSDTSEFSSIFFYGVDAMLRARLPPGYLNN